MENYLPAEEITLVHSGHNYFEVLEKIINQSGEILHLQTYIFLADGTGQRIVSALKGAVERGVKVFVLIDAFGSYPSAKLLSALEDAGVTCRLFSPLFSSESIYFGRRLHHKIVVADKRVALTGGINLADKYNEVGNEQAWLDYAVLVKGEVCEYLHLLCEQFYHKLSAKVLVKWERRARLPGAAQIRYRRNDWIKRWDEIHSSYVHAIAAAKGSITLVASYFLPGALFRRLLKNAARRGVQVTIILAGKSDSASLRLAERYLYGFYIRNGIRVYEWRNSVMHGKAMLVDQSWASVGSYNVNYLSRYLSVELNVDVIDLAFVNELADHLEDICRNDCNFIDEKQLKKTSWWKSRFMWLAYNFHRLLQNMMMLGRKYRDHKLNSR